MKLRTTLTDEQRESLTTYSALISLRLEEHQSAIRHRDKLVEKQDQLMHEVQVLSASVDPMQDGTPDLKRLAEHRTQLQLIADSALPAAERAVGECERRIGEMGQQNGVEPIVGPILKAELAAITNEIENFLQPFTNPKDPNHARIVARQTHAVCALTGATGCYWSGATVSHSRLLQRYIAALLDGENPFWVN